MDPSEASKNTKVFWRNRESIEGLRTALILTLQHTNYKAEDIADRIITIWGDNSGIHTKTLKRFALPHGAKGRTEEIRGYEPKNRLLISINSIWGEVDEKDVFLNSAPIQKTLAGFRSALGRMEQIPKDLENNAIDKQSIEFHKKRSGNDELDQVRKGLESTLEMLHVRKTTFEEFPLVAFDRSGDEPVRPLFMVCYSASLDPNRIVKYWLAIPPTNALGFSHFVRAFDFLGRPKITDGITIDTGKATYLIGQKSGGAFLEVISLERAFLGQFMFSGVQITSDLHQAVTATNLIGFNLRHAPIETAKQFTDHSSASCRDLAFNALETEREFLEKISDDPDRDLEKIRIALDPSANTGNFFPYD